MEPDWDLYAVVRGCTTVPPSSSSTTSTTTTTTTTTAASSGLGTCHQPSSSCTFFSIFPAEKAGQVLSLSNPLEAKGSIEELHELCKPFFLKSKPRPSFQTSSPLSSLSYSSAPKSPLTQQKQKQTHTLAGSATTPRSKRRKNQLKKICQVQAENLSSDIWAWRKYGQKPIKGSPYPRGYYRCSSSKGCLARKQVERNKSDPTMFIVTYTGEHSHPAPIHRNSLAGSTRQKLVTPQTATTGGDSGKSPEKPFSPATSVAEEEEVGAPLRAESEDMEDLMNDDEEENEFGLSDMVVTDDFFEGLDEFTGSVKVANEDCFVDPFAANVALPSWMANNAATAAGGS